MLQSANILMTLAGKASAMEMYNTKPLCKGPFKASASSYAGMEITPQDVQGRERATKLAQSDTSRDAV